MYPTAVVAASLGVDLRTVDGIAALAPKLHSGARGKARSFSADVVELFAIALLIRRDLGTPLARAVALAEQLMTSGGSSVRAGTLFHLHLDRGRLQGVLRQALADAVAATSVPRRGRPPRITRRGAL